MQQARCELLGQPDAPTPHQCWHCAQAPCLEACPSGAMQRDAGSGLVRVDRSRCVGCWMCVLACPFGAVIPSADGRHACKCDGCLDRNVPACAGSCQPRDVLFQPDLRTETVRQRRAGFASAGWGWPGPNSYPPPTTSPKSVPPAARPEKPIRYVVAGTSIAAVRAVEAMRAADPQGHIVMVSDETTPPYSRVLLSHHIAGIRDVRSLSLRSDGWCKEIGVEVVAGDGARGLDVERRLVILSSGRELPYDRLLIATGASSVRLPIPGADLEGVIGLRNLPDAAAIAAAPPQEAVVVGGGFIGIKAAEALHQLGTRVTIVEKLGQLLPLMLDEVAAEMVRSRLEAHGIRVVTGTGVREIEGDGQASGVMLESGERIGGTLVIVGVGVKPNVAWLRGSPVEVNRGVVVDGQMRTSVPDVWAAGDVVESCDLISGTRIVNAIWPIAATQGRVAGVNMAGGVQQFAGSLPMNTLNVFGMAVASFGQVRSEIESVAVHEPTCYIKKVYRSGALVGAVLVGDLREAGRLMAEASGNNPTLT